MARLYPGVFPRASDQHDAESRMFDELKELPDNYSVFYSRQFKGVVAANEECEADFIVFDGTKSLLCIEVKGGVLAYDGQQDAWTQNGRRMDKSPIRQVGDEKAALLEWLGSDAGGLNVGWALCFPDCSLPDDAQLPSGLPADVVLDQTALLDITESVRQAEQYYASRYGRRGVPPDVARRVVEKLTRGIGFVVKLGVRIAQDYSQLVQVTNEQFGVLEDLEANNRMVVKGYAGTGKTILAQEFAKRLADHGQRVLLVFYNKLVADTVRHGLERDAGIDCTTFHSMAKRLVEEHFPEWWEEEKESGEEFWSTELPLKLFDIPKDKLPHYDAVIVDEGQDFKREWYEFLESLLRDKESSRFVVFYDENQDIFGRWTDLPWGSSAVPRKILKHNCRNTRAIIDYIKGQHPCDMEPFARSPDGVRVVERQCRDSRDERSLFIKDLVEVLKDGVPPASILIMPNKEKAESVIKDIDVVAEHKIEWGGRRWDDNSKSVRYASIKTFKGLEADILFMLDCDSMTEAEFKDAIYVQGSRARTALYVYRPTRFKNPEVRPG